MIAWHGNRQVFSDFQAQHQIELALQAKQLGDIHDADVRAVEMCLTGVDLGEFQAEHIPHPVFMKPGEPGAGATADVNHTGGSDKVDYQRNDNGSGAVGTIAHCLIELSSISGTHCIGRQDPA
jgi:hypothetical protein